MRRLLCNFFILYVLAIANGILFSYLNEEFFHYSTGNTGKENFSKTGQFLILVFFGPIIETFLLQWLPNFILTKLKVKNVYLLVLIPSVLFAFWHNYHPIYMASTFIGGILLNAFYVKCKAQTRYYLSLTMLFHSLYNLTAFLLANC